MSRPSAPRRGSRPITVAGTFKIGNTLYDSDFIFMPLDEAQAFFNHRRRRQRHRSDGDRSRQRPGACCRRIAKAAGRDARLVPWQDINSAFFEAMQVEGNVMFLILSLIILVAALNIVSGLIMLVKDKSADIATVMALCGGWGLHCGMKIGVTGLCWF